MPRPRLLSSLLPIAFLSACGADPVGVYETTPESFRQSFAESFPKGDNAATKALRARFTGMRGKVTLMLDASHRFELTWELPLLPAPKRDSGSWKQVGDTVELTPAAPPKSGPATWTAHLKGDSISLQQSPQAPRFVLRKTKS